MKKIISLLALAVLVSSCGNRLSMLKRHYTGGYYVESNKKSHHPGLVKAETKNKQVEKTQPVVVSFLSDKKELPAEILASAAGNVVTKKEEKSSFQSQLKNHNGALNQGIIIKKSPEKIQIPVAGKQKQTKGNKGGSDTDLLILVILSLFPFINLIAMYLHDGKKATLNLWVDLILDLLFFFPGIIFALLVVLNVINLA